MARVGLIARANDKGLGWQTYEAYRHFPFAKTLVVLIDDPQFRDHPERYDQGDVTFVQFDRRGGVFNKASTADWLRDLDVVFSAETLYDWSLARWARDLGVRTVVQGNPEFYVHGRPEYPDLAPPHAWVWPTSWRPFDDLPDGPILPCPVVDLGAPIAADPDAPFVVTHVAGHRAAGDRNGTESFLAALPYIRTEVTVRLVGQDGGFTGWPHRVPRNVTLETHIDGMPDRWDLYRGAHLVVLPRRYGGNCLPANEACAAGCALAMTLVEPNQEWPIYPLQAKAGPLHRAPGGVLRTAAVRPQSIAQAIDSMNRDRGRLERHQSMAWEWSRRRTWEALLPLYHEVLS